MSQVQVAEAQNFDNVFSGPREFILGGQRFNWKQLHWREWGAFLDAEVVKEREAARAQEEKLNRLRKEAEQKGEDPNAVVVEDPSTVVESFEGIIDRIRGYIEPSELQRFNEVIEDKEKRISIEQLQLLLVWLREVQTPERPTSTPEASESGPGDSEPISQVA